MAFDTHAQDSRLEFVFINVLDTEQQSWLQHVFFGKSSVW